MKVYLAISIALLLFFETANGQVGSLKNKPGRQQLRRIYDLLGSWKPKDIPSMLRLAFHQCVGTSCNACVDITHPENQGFDEAIEFFERVHSHPEVFPYMTKSDLIAWAVIKILHLKIQNNNRSCGSHKRCAIPTPEWQYWWGRKDGCERIGTKVDNTPNDFPTTLMNRTEMMDFFKKDFGFSEAEVTLLVGGAHSLGGTHKQFSNYHGNFSKPGTYGLGFNNKPFKKLTMNVTEIRMSTNYPDSNVQKFFQFDTKDHRHSTGMMLNSEVVATYDVELHPLEGTRCKINDVSFDNNNPIDPDLPYCKKSSTWDVAYKYATDAPAFSQDFFDLMVKMFMKGHEGQLEKLDMIYLQPWLWEEFI